MKKTVFASALGLLCMVASCSDDDDKIEDVYKPYDPEQGYNSPIETKASESYSLLIKYAGKTYNVPCALVNDSLVYLDENFNTLYKNEISQISELAALSYQDEQGNKVVEYYHSATELEEENGIFDFAQNDLTNNIQPFTYTIEPKAGRAILYDDTNFNDRTLPFDIDYDYLIAIPDLKNYIDPNTNEAANFNDKTSAIRVFNFLKPDSWYSPSYAFPGSAVKGNNLRTCLIGYEDSNYGGKTLYCVAPYTEGQNLNDPSTASHQDNRLKDLGWNDKISSIVFRIITVDNISSGDIIPHE